MPPNERNFQIQREITQKSISLNLKVEFFKRQNGQMLRNFFDIVNFKWRFTNKSYTTIKTLRIFKTFY